VAHDDNVSLFCIYEVQEPGCAVVSFVLIFHINLNKDGQGKPFVARAGQSCWKTARIYYHVKLLGLSMLLQGLNQEYAFTVVFMPISDRNPPNVRSYAVWDPLLSLFGMHSLKQTCYNGYNGYNGGWQTCYTFQARAIHFHDMRRFSRRLHQIVQHWTAFVAHSQGFRKYVTQCQEQ